MTEIKFKYLYPVGEDGEYKVRFYTIEQIENHSELISEIPEHRLLYTGFKDKNGVEIYDGDIIERNQPDIPAWRMGKSSMLLRVIWDQEYCCFTLERFREHGNGPSNESNRWSVRTAKYDKIIGNIHTNPELLLDNR